MTFGEKLKELRNAKRWSQKELAEKANVSQQAITEWENGKKVPLFTAVQALCKALGENLRAFENCEHGPVPENRGRRRPKKA